MTVSSKIYAGTPSPAGPVWLAFDCVRAEASVRRKLQRLAAGEVVFIGRFAARFGIRDYASFHEFLQVLVQRLHAELLTGLDRRVHLRDLGLAYQVVDGRRAYHDLVRGDPAGTVLGLEQRLRNDRAQGGGDHRADHVLLGSRMVSRSRISPTRITSGSSRSALRSALLKDRVCGPTSRWLIRHFFDSCTNSIGSSMVRMCPSSVSFLWLTIAASVVDLPDPVGPVTSTTPRG